MLLMLRKMTDKSDFWRNKIYLYPYRTPPVIVIDHCPTYNHENNSGSLTNSEPYSSYWYGKHAKQNQIFQGHFLETAAITLT